MYQITIQNFSGTLDLLLQLVEKKNLAITELSLAQVTQEYVTFVNEQEQINAEDLAEFLVIASTLLLIKSRSLLPSLTLAPEEENEILDLETRLKIYQLYKIAGEEIKKMFRKEIYIMARSGWKNVEPQFLPPPHLSADILSLSFQKILSELQIEDTPLLAEKKIKKIQTLEERIKTLLQKITQGSRFRLQDLSLNKNDKIDLILTFLAALHLAKKKIITIKQNNNFDDIWILNQS
ncbi:MAG: segregation/condensation protein A [Parcubacteria group bacterium]|nr:segregation/condensation protein A [Parcubacteria group bacterium]